MPITMEKGQEKGLPKMGMSASQARLLTITARMHDVEYRAQSIQNAKIALANQENEVLNWYNEALDATTFTVKDNNGERIVANFNTLCGIDAAKFSKSTRYLLRDENNKIIVSDDIYKGYETFGSGKDPYRFALFMMTGKQDENDEIFNEAEKTALDQEDKYTSNLKDIKKALVDKLLDAFQTYYYGDIDGIKYDNREGIENDITGAYSCFAAMEDDYQDPSSGNSEEIAATKKSKREAFFKTKESIDNLFGEYKYSLYTQFADTIFEASGNNKNDFDNDDFWYYVNMYKQIESNGGTIKKISDYNGLEGIGVAATDSDWLQRMVQSGKITIDISTLDSKGNINFKSTAVSSDSSLEYTTSSTVDRSALAKAEAEYEHKMKEIDRKDKKFDLDLNRLETERTALKTEYESVKKVAEDNIERTFGIFS